ncbi:MAG: nucleoside deaminase [Oscillospiraceae bacterium]
MQEMSDFDYMREAMTLAETAAAMGEVPVGAVVVERATGAIIGRGYNLREKEHSPLAHAEIIAMEQAARHRGDWRLSGCILYVTLEPCPMCSGAIINARIDRVVFGAYDPKGGAVRSVEEMFSLPYAHQPRVTAGLLQDPCTEQLQAFFQSLRQK